MVQVNGEATRWFYAVEFYDVFIYILFSISKKKTLAMYKMKGPVKKEWVRKLIYILWETNLFQNKIISTNRCLKDEADYINVKTNFYI